MHAGYPTTHEDKDELDAATGLGCKCCDEPTETNWWVVVGDIYCDKCVRMLIAECGTKESECRALPTRAQLATTAAWEAAGIGTN